LAPVTPQPAVVLERVLGVLRPLVRLLVRHGVTYPVFAAALKRVFLDAARAELNARGMATTDSAVTLLSGVHRRDVRELTRGAKAAPGELPAPRSGLGLATEVVARWLHDPAWGGGADAGSAPVLPRGGERGFDALVQSLSSDVRPRAVLDELLRLGVVSESDEGVRLAVGGLVPRRGFDEMAWLFAHNLHDHAAAAAANLDGERDFLEQAVFVDEIGAASVSALHRTAVAAWREASRRVVAEARSRLDTDAAELPPEARCHRLRFGVYFYSEEPSA
jgi:hypothetical protein